MKIERTWVHFDENGETIVGRKGKIKTDTHQSLFLELHDVQEKGDTIRLHINDYLCNILSHIETDFVRVICKDASRNFVNIYPYEAYEQPCDVFDEVSSLLRREELLSASADLIRFRNNLKYTDEYIDELLYELQEYLLEQLREVLDCVD